MNERQRKNKWFRENGNVRKQCSGCGSVFIAVGDEDRCKGCL